MYPGYLSQPGPWLIPNLVPKNPQFRRQKKKTQKTNQFLLHGNARRAPRCDEIRLILREARPKHYRYYVDTREARPKFTFLVEKIISKDVPLRIAFILIAYY